MIIMRFKQKIYFGIAATALLASMVPLWGAGMAMAQAKNEPQEDEYSFDPEEIEKKPYTLGGFLELGGASLSPNEDSALYRFRYLNEENPPDHINQGNLNLQLEGSYTLDAFAFKFRGNTAVFRDDLGTRRDTVWQEAFLSLQPSSSVTFDVGKRVAKWGKGYAWNPVAFVDRPKNPTDPEASLEGFVMGRAEAIQSFEGSVQNGSVTLAIIPVDKGLNEDFGAVGEERAFNVAAKLYLLAMDTDFDLLVLAEGTRSARWGFDFSRNLGSQLEMHGEWARISEVNKPVLDESGLVTQRSEAARPWLLGLRYLTGFQMTAILEIYHNDAGYTAEELETYYRFADEAYQQFATTGVTTALDKAETLLRSGYGRANPGRDYLYMRLSQKEPFEWLYFTPALTALFNRNDGSRAITVEAGYTGVTNLEMRVRHSILQGDRFTEYDEKVNESKTEFRLRGFF